MSKVGICKVTCACCKKEVEVEKIWSVYARQLGMDGDLHNHIQYKMQECPICHYTAIDIEDSSVRVSKGMLNAFHLQAMYEKIEDPIFRKLMKAADIYEKNNNYYVHSHIMRLASFYSAELGEYSIARNLLKQANESLEKYFAGIDEMTLTDVEKGIIFADCNRQLGMLQSAKGVCEELLGLLESVEAEQEIELFRRLLRFELMLIEKKDLKKHLVSEA